MKNWKLNIAVSITALSLVFSGLTAYTALTKVPARMVSQPGTVVAYAGATEPNWCLFMYGQTVSTTTYAALYGVIGTTYNTGGETAGTFRLPDMRGRTIFGQDDMGGSDADRITTAVAGFEASTLGASGGDQRLHTHNHTQASHDHGGSTGNMCLLTKAGPGNSGNPYFALHNATDGCESHSHTISSATPVINNSGTGSSQNVPPGLVLNWCIAF